MAILTISRQYGSGGREIGQAIAEQMKYGYINKESIHHEITKSGKKWELWGKELDEHCPTMWEKHDWSFKGFSALVQSILFSEALKNNIVLMGRGGNFLLKDVPFALRIRVVASLEKRVLRITKRDAVDTGTARWLAGKIDNERDCFIRAIYGKHWEDAGAYDMVFDTTDKSLDEVVETVKAALLKKDAYYTAEARRDIEMRALAARVKAGILTDPHLFIPTLDVFHEQDTLILKGVIHSPKEHKRIEEAAQKLAGAVSIRCELHYRR